MSTSTYGIAPPVRGPRVSGPSLMQVGGATLDTGMSTMAGAADAETQRSLTNQELKQGSKAGIAQLGAVAGGVLGAVYGGPAGAMAGSAIGSALGGVVGGMF